MSSPSRPPPLTLPAPGPLPPAAADSAATAAATTAATATDGGGGGDLDLTHLGGVVLPPADSN